MYCPFDHSRVPYLGEMWL